MCTWKIYRYMLLAGAAALTFSGNQALAADPGAPCGQYDLYPKYIEVEYIDNPPTGTSLGDARVGQIAMVTSDDKEVAQLFFHSVVVPGGNDVQHNLLLTSHFIFPDGGFPWSLMYQRPNLADSVPGPSIVAGVVAGGTGSFSQTSGTVTMDYDQDNKRVYRFDLTCPAN